MEQYISKSALVAEIEKLKLCTMDEHMNFYSEAAEGEYHALSNLESFLDTLEVKEIGVDIGDPKGDIGETTRMGDLEEAARKQQLGIVVQEVMCFFITIIKNSSRVLSGRKSSLKRI